MGKEGRDRGELPPFSASTKRVDGVTFTLAVLALIVASITCVTAALNFHTSRSNQRRIQEVHILVNSKFSAAITRIDQLTQTLERADVAVPPDPKA